jgi:nucleotide-binding universal stress UspA family protein
MKSRKPLGTIVHGSDFSGNARLAGNVAAALAAKLLKPLSVVHVVDDASVPRSRATSRGAVLRPAKSALRIEEARLRKRGGTVRGELRVGRPDEALVAAAKESGASLLVLSSLGRRPAGSWLMGTVSERTAESSPVPTLVVRSDAPFEAWLQGERPLRVFVAFDFSVTSEAAVEWVRSLLAAGPCEVTVGHLNWPPEVRERFGIAPPWALENPPAVQRVLEQRVRERVAVLLGRHDARVSVRPSWERPDFALMAMAKEAEADLIVVGTRQRDLLSRAFEGSVSRGLLRNAAVSVACVPSPVSARRLPRVGPVRRILVTTDFSPAGNLAIAWACALAQPGGTVRAIHVVHPQAIADGQYERQLGASTRHHAHKLAVGRRLQALLPGEAPAGVGVEAVLVENVAATKGICEEAERFGADLIVMSSEGMTGVTRGLLGSVAQGVMAKSGRTVLIVRSPKD